MSSLQEAKGLAKQGQAAAAAQALRQARASLTGYLPQLNAAKLLAGLAEKPEARAGLQTVRLAVLGSSTTQQLIPLLRLHAFWEGLDLQVYDAPFNAYQQDILDPGSGLYRSQPQAVLLYVNYRDAQPGPAEAEAARWAALWDALRARASCPVLANNFDLPAERPWGNLEACRPDQGIGRLRRLNALLAERAGRGVFLLDQEHLSAVVGKERWHDPRFWLHSRQAVALDALPRYAAEAIALLKAVLGRSRKVLAVDLDNTLWGGVVGDDGPADLAIGETPQGEAFLEFQRYLKALRERGVLLAVCSKNDPQRAREPFLTRPEMALKLEDFSAFEASWGDKGSGLRAIARKLNVGLDSVAFADDSPLERETVRRSCPEVAVVDLPEDPADWVRALDAARLFEAGAVSAEDGLRTAHFQAEDERGRLRDQAPDLGSFLRELDMKAEAGPFRPEDLARIAQLINKTNQFNLTTRRYSEEQVRAFSQDPAFWTLAVRLRDRFGDYGLISVLIARRGADALDLDTWLMSCRVFGRGVEDLAFDRLLAAAKERGVRRITARYVPSAKNEPVRGLLPGLGFAQQADGAWALDTDGARPRGAPIQDG